jgi:hypothetical protein
MGLPTKKYPGIHANWYTHTIDALRCVKILDRASPRWLIRPLAWQVVWQLKYINNIIQSTQVVETRLLWAVPAKQHHERHRGKSMKAKVYRKLHTSMDALYSQFTRN